MLHLRMGSFPTGLKMDSTLISSKGFQTVTLPVSQRFEVWEKPGDESTAWPSTILATV